MKNILFGIVIGCLIPIVAAVCFVRGGGMPVPTQGAPLPMERTLAKWALHAAMDKEVDRPSPVKPDEANFLAGARVYQAQCAVCHGRLGQPATAIATGMFPRPPQLLPPKKGVTDDSVGETYWKVKNGIRLTGMPGYGTTLSDPEMWQVSLLLLHADNLPGSVQELLRRPN